MACSSSLWMVAGDEPVYLTVRNTFFEVEGLRTPSSRSLRTRSEPSSFRLGGLGKLSMTDDEDALSAASTEASSEDERSLQRPVLLPPAILRNDGTQAVAMEQGACSLSPSSCRGDVSCARDRRPTYVPTPSTFGRRTPENLPRSSAKRVSFAFSGASSDSEFGEEPQRKTSCLRKSSWTGRRTHENSPTTPARRVSFAAFDEVVHIPAEEVPSLEHAPAAVPERAAEVLKVEEVIPTVVPAAALRSTGQPWSSFSVAAPAFVPMSALVRGASTSSAAAAPVKACAAPVGAVTKPWSESGAAPSVPVPARAPAVASTSAAQSRPSARGPWAKFSEVVESVRASLEVSMRIVACVEAKEGARGWTITAYVQPKALKPCRDQLLAAAQQALVAATGRSDSVVLLGYGATPFSPMPLGFGAALADMPDQSVACWASFSKGFCDKPGACCRDHPKCQVGVNVMLKPARPRGR